MCYHIESLTANILFHKVRFGVHKVFTIIYEMSSYTKSVLSTQIARRLNITKQTAWLFMCKVRSALKSTVSQPITGKLFVDEFVFGEKRSVKRAYLKKTDNYFFKELISKALITIFDSHILINAKITTEKCKDYLP